MGGELFLRVLGPLRLERDGQQVDIGGTRQREVLARLVGRSRLRH
jgi:DNA-binding SARP family transcriptional activator